MLNLFNTLKTMYVYKSNEKWKIDDSGLVPIFKKNISNICDFRFFTFSFDLCTDIILKQLNKIENLFFFNTLFTFLCCFPFCFPTFHFSLLCFPIVVPVVLPRCTTPLLGRSPRANRCENWWLRTCAHLHKNSSKEMCDFHFFLPFTYRHYFKAI